MNDLPTATFNSGAGEHRSGPPACSPALQSTFLSTVRRVINHNERSNHQAPIPYIVGSSTMHHLYEYVIVESAPLPDLPMQRMAHTGALNIPLSDSATSCDAAERGSLSPPELPTRAKRTLGNNNNLFAPRCHFWVEVFQRRLLSVVQVFYSAEPTYPITAKYLRILSPEKSRRGRPNPSLFRLRMG